jgi:hypothetical protein
MWILFLDPKKSALNRYCKVFTIHDW